MTNPNRMINVRIDGTTFVYRVAALCLRDDRILICRPPDLDFWYTPGGRVHIGEDSFTALNRELLEEVGTSAKSAELIWVLENFFTDATQSIHEIGLYFRVELPEEAESLGRDGVTTRIETGDETILEWRWLPIAEVTQIDLRPPILRDLLQSIDQGFKHAIEHRTAR